MPEFDPTTHVVVKRTHRRIAFFVVVLLIGIAAAGAYVYRGQTLYVNGKAVVAVPDFTQKIQLKTPDGKTAEVQLPPPVLPEPNGKTTKVTDGLDGGDKLQRTVIDTDRYDPIARLGAQMKSANDTTALAVSGVADSVKSLAGTVKDLATNIRDLSTEVKSQGADIKDAVSRIVKLETPPAPPAPVQPAPAPQTAAPAPGPTSEAAPVQTPAPQASLPARTKMAANTDGVDPAEVAAAASAYKALGPAPGGGQINSHMIVQGPNGFAPCPNGHKRRVVEKVHVDGFTHWRTTCD